MERTAGEIEDILKAMDAGPGKFMVIGTDYLIRAFNRYTRDLYPVSLKGRKCHEALNSLDAPCPNCPVNEIIRKKAPVFRYRDPRGGTKPQTCRYAYPVISGDTVEAVAVLESDNPMSNNIEEQLYLSNALLRNLILSSVDGVMAADTTGKILIFNEAAAKISGYQIEEALSRLNIRDVYPNDGARDIMCKLRSDDHGGRGKLKSCKVDVLRKDGEILPINLNAAIVYEGDKEVASIGFFHDMREEIQMKAALEKTQVQLLQAEKMSSLGKLSAGVAHQLNNPLGGITLYTKLLLEEKELDAETREDLNRILQEALKCRDTVKELLEFARQTSHLVRPHDLNRAISRTLFLLENQSLFQNITIHKELDERLPPVEVDMQQMNHVFMNIILNAAQAMEGRGELRVSTHLNDRDNTIVIRLADTGPGIPDEVLPHIFEPFYTTKEEGKGTGLGLSMVYGIVENHGGRISVESQAGRGAAFVIELPLKAGGQSNGGEYAE